MNNDTDNKIQAQNVKLTQMVLDRVRSGRSLNDKALLEELKKLEALIIKSSVIQDK